MSQPTSQPLRIRHSPANETKDTNHVNDALRTYAPLVDRVLSGELRRLPRCVDQRDLRAAGMAALLAAVRRSVHSSEEMFIAYAKIRIRGAIMDELRRLDWSPRRRKAPPGAGLSDDVIAAPFRIVAMGEIDDHDVHRDASTLETPLDAIIRSRESADLRHAVRTLPQREAQVVRLRYFEEMPSREIAAVMRVSEARISQINASATRKLRALLVDCCDDLAVAA